MSANICNSLSTICISYNQNNIFNSIELYSDLEGDYLSQLVEVINTSNGFSISEIELVLFNFHPNEPGEPDFIIQYIWSGGKGTWGAGGVPVTNLQFIPLIGDSRVEIPTLEDVIAVNEIANSTPDFRGGLMARENITLVSGITGNIFQIFEDSGVGVMNGLGSIGYNFSNFVSQGIGVSQDSSSGLLGIIGSINSSSLTANRNYDLPDKTGTFALLDDIPTTIPGFQDVLSENSNLSINNIIPINSSSGFTLAGNLNESGIVSAINFASNINPQAQIGLLDSFGVVTKGVQVYKDKMIILDSKNNKGLEYASHYDSNYTEFSIPDKKYVDDKDALKQNLLVSGTNIKTINGNSILGSGNIKLNFTVIEDVATKSFTGPTTHTVGTYTIPANTIPANCMIRTTLRFFKTGTNLAFSTSLASTSMPQTRLVNNVSSGAITNTFMQIVRENTVNSGKMRYFDTSGSTYHTYAANNAVYANVDFDVTVPQTFVLTVTTSSITDTIIFDSLIVEIL